MLGPKSKLALVAVHYDEARPHMHVVASVVGGDGLPGWESVMRSSPVPGNGKEFLENLQTDFHQHVSKKYGLERGESGGPRRNEPVDRTKSEESRIKSLESELEGAQNMGKMLCVVLQALEKRNPKLVTSELRRHNVLAEGVWTVAENYKGWRPASPSAAERSKPSPSPSPAR